MLLFTMALGAIALGFMLKWHMLRGWSRYYANPKDLAFPVICPVCLQPADALVEEDSMHRVTADAVIFRHVEWWSAKIPHCSKCQQKQIRDLIIGLSLAAICIIAVFIFAPKTGDQKDVIAYFFFAYPFYVIADNLRKGISLGRDRSGVLPIRIRRSEYFDKLAALNSAPTARDVPLGENKGVWRH